jgi:hypothetical protein
MIAKYNTTSKCHMLSTDIAIRIGKLLSQCQLTKQYSITIKQSFAGPGDIKIYATGISYIFNPVQNSMYTHPGVYSLRTNRLDLPAHVIWEIFIKETSIESIEETFRTLKSQTGFLPDGTTV